MVHVDKPKKCPKCDANLFITDVSWVLTEKLEITLLCDECDTFYESTIYIVDLEMEEVIDDD